MSRTRAKTTPASTAGSFATHAHGAANVDLHDTAALEVGAPAPGDPLAEVREIETTYAAAYEAALRGESELNPSIAHAVMERLPALLARLESAETTLRRLAADFDRFDQQPSFTGNYDVDTATSSAWHEAANHVHAVIDGTAPDPTQRHRGRGPR